MDTLRLADLNAVDLTISADRGRAMYLATDRRTGEILELPEPIAMAMRRGQKLVAGGDVTLSKPELQAIYAALSTFDRIRRQGLEKAAKFNPLFQSFELFDVGRYAPELARLARAVLRPALGWAVALLALACLWLGARTDWAILGAFRDVFSLEAIATFALIAPLLKVIHELGHVLTALRLGAPVRTAGIMLIGMYPMPFVNISDADVTVGRRERILISLAGLFTDIVVAMVAFVAWHLVDGTFWTTLLGNIFVFSAINSVLFNANPLIKLDGYFAMSDAIGERNLNANAMTAFRATRRWVTALGHDGARPRGRRGWAMLGYALLSALYKVWIIVSIVWALLPKFLGLGVLLVGWGIYATFFSPLLADSAVPQVSGDPERRAKARRIRRLMLAGFAAGLAALLLLWRPAPVLLLPLTLDVGETYALTVETQGAVAELRPDGPVAEGEALLALANPALVARAEVLALEREQAALELGAAQGVNEARAQVARSQLDAFEERLALSRQSIDALVRTAPGPGTFVAAPGLQRGAWLTEGAPYGTFLPDAASARMRADFPEAWLRRFEDGAVRGELRSEIGVLGPVLDKDAMSLVERAQRDDESGVRSFALTAEVPLPPAEAASSRIHMRLVFPREPAWRHVLFWGEGLVETFREAQLRDRIQRLD
ncbi:hypothetical protein OG2516_11511 [Oceanicola granulosus HTCC2516]|uniref:Peptidase, M50 family protein n=1 Tax=Oceanicola granulosus (strain ATCC BAA-861 / DSM 15982 / KCTC 12143 / HTCC2516) TaxID=314256 RepID=Q2CJQ1_OCEGH|nr:M50 family metallopeptidase [Oceanicola granulosus]EAR53088.1 hypothetical protein OG2516_11511 [Oceanicola granulosus HTCC2516]